MWSATHKIVFVGHNGRRRTWVVGLAPEGAAYTYAEWTAYGTADWECDNGVWTFQGQALPGPGTVVVRALRRGEA